MSFANKKNNDIIMVMKNKTISSNDNDIFLLKSFFWIAILGWGSFLAALIGQFYWQIISVVFVLAALPTLYIFIKKNLFKKLSLEFKAVGIIVAIIIILFSLNSTPTIFSGRDQGAISEAAIRLSQNNKLQFQTPASDSFFKVYGEGKALNFPGFYYTSSGALTTQFPLVYISWLAFFYSVFGLNGFAIANGILMFFFFMSLYFLFRKYVPVSFSILALAFALTAFPFSWFIKFTLSENMALALLWISILAFVNFLEKQRNLYYFSFLLSCSLLVFTRIEGITVFFLAFAIALINKPSRLFLKSNIKKAVLFPAILLLLIFGLNFFVDMPFYKEMAKAFLNSASSNINNDNVGYKPGLHLTNIFFSYGMLGFFIFGFLGFATSFIKKQFKIIIPFLIILPTTFYFASSQISPDHPWMLRRFIFSLLPAFIFYTAIFISHLFSAKKKIFLAKTAAILITIILFAQNIYTTSQFFTFSENRTLLEQTEKISSNFSKNDLVLIDKDSSGDNWAMLTGPMSFLFHKNAVYFFNINDIEKLDLNKYNKVYLISPREKVNFYLTSDLGKRLIPVKSYDLITQRLEIDETGNSESIAKKKTVEVSGEIFKVKK